jgi:hypothetical protein
MAYMVFRIIESSSEIKELDSERQSLVYNHHHELIAARDTIAAVCLFIEPRLSLDAMLPSANAYYCR